MAGRTPKNSPETWIEVAKRTLIDEGIANVKVDRLAKRLGVTRGGFYHNFKHRDELLALLIDHWEKTCRFLPDGPPPSESGAAVQWMDALVARLIDGDGYEHRFDLAVRDWARSDTRAEWAVERADRERLATLRKFFEAIGYDSENAEIRARIFYYHQIGYYAIGVRHSNAERRRSARLYMNILCGEAAIEAARASASKARSAHAA